jgi:hypothetical protein
VIGYQPLKPFDRNRFIHNASNALLFAGMVTNPATNHREGVRIPYDLHGFIELALGGGNDVTRNIHPDRANFTAGGRSVDRCGIDNRYNFPIGHLGDEMALLMTSKANGVGLHFQIFLSFPYH